MKNKVFETDKQTNKNFRKRLNRLAKLENW